METKWNERSANIFVWNTTKVRETVKHRIRLTVNFVIFRKFVAYIDPENKFAVEDKLSQINTLEQLSNIASYGFLKKRLETHDLHVKYF